MRSREAAALAAAALLLAITAAWWALALWPAPAGAAWVVRAREVCFGTGPTGLPDAAGWMALVLQPTIMFGVLFAVWGRALEGGLSALTSRLRGRLALGAVGLVLGAGLTAATVRILDARGAAGVFGDPAVRSPPLAGSRLDRAAPTMRLVDQHGQVVTLDRFRGRPVVVTFAFGHCETVCPAVVHDVLRACERTADLDPVALVVTLDPWRDVPARLPHLAEQWALGARGHVLSGTVEQVEAVLDDWQVGRARDPSTGDIAHPRLVYLIDRDGKVAFATSGTSDDLATLLRRL